MPSARRAPHAAALSSHHFASLDGYRGLAFLLVFLRHYTVSSHLTGPAMRSVQYWAQAGWVGVDLFFALSGLLITGILLDTTGHPHYLRNFMVRRALRILPLPYGIAVALALLTPVLHLQWQRGHLLYLVFLGNVGFCLHPGLAAVPPSLSLLHLWSLAVEEQFYLLWPAVLYVLIRTGHRRRLLPLCLALSVGSLLLRLALLGLHIPDALDWIYTMLPTHMDGFLFGGAAALLLRTVPLEQLRAPARWAIAAAALALVPVVLYGGPDIYSNAMVLAGFPALAVLFTAVLLLSLHPGSLAGRLGNVRILRFFGRYSYGMYIFHLLFWPATGPLLTGFQGRLGSRLVGGLAYVAVMLAATTAVSVLSYQLYEERWLRLKADFADRPASSIPAVAS